MPLQTRVKEHLPELLCTAFGLLVLYWQWFSIDADGIAYTDIAMKWGAGLYGQAVNAFWSPLWSWLLIPLLRIIGHPHISIRLLQFMLLLMGLRLWKKWVTQMAHPENQSGSLMRFIGGLNLACLSQVCSGPDFLACILTVEFCRKLIIQKPSFFTLGLWLALLYYTQMYLLFFGVLALISVWFYRFYFNKEQLFTLPSILKLAGTAILAAFIIFPWSNALHKKYKKWMMGSSQHYHSIYQFAGGTEPAWKNAGLVAPPDEHSTFLWTDITKRIGDFRSRIKQNNKGKTAILSYNLLKTLRMLAISACAGFLAILFFWRVRKKLSPEQKDRIVLHVLFAALYVGGYLLLLPEQRHLWPVFMILSGLTMCLPRPVLPIKNKYVYALALCCIILPHSIYSAFENRQSIKEHLLAVALEPVVPKGAHIATFKTGQTWSLSFYNRYRDYGGIYNNSNKTLRADLELYDIRYILVTRNDLEQTENLLAQIGYTKRAIKAGSWYVLKLN